MLQENKICVSTKRNTILTQSLLINLYETSHEYYANATLLNSCIFNETCLQIIFYTMLHRKNNIS